VDIRETIEVKIEALKKHASQIGDWNVGEWLRAWAEETGKEKGMKFAEAFKVMILEEEEDRE